MGLERWFGVLLVVVTHGLVALIVWGPWWFQFGVLVIAASSLVGLWWWAIFGRFFVDRPWGK